MADPISTLQEVQTWLGTLSVGQTVNVGSSLFSSTLISALFSMLPSGEDPIAVTVSKIDTSGATLTGTATILGEQGTTVVFQFTQPESTLLLELTLTLPASVEWTLFSGWDVTFGGLGAQFAPNTDLNVITLTLSGSLKAGTSLTLPITLSIPSFSGDWTLQGSFTSIGSLAEDGLKALLGGNDLMSMLQGAFDLSQLSITDIELAFNPYATPKPTFTMIRLALSYGVSWKFFNDTFEVKDLDFDIELLRPFSSAMSFQGIVSATMEIPAGGTPFDVGLQFPDYAVFARLAPESSLSVTNAFSFFHVDLPSGFPDVEITTLSFIFFVGNNSFNFQLGIAKPFPILGDVSLNNFDFAITAANSGGTISGSGSLTTSFTLGPTTLVLGGSYATGQGLSLNGLATNVQLGQIIDAIASQFGIPSSSIPAPIQQLKLQSLSLGLTTGSTNSFSFSLQGTTTIAGVGVQFTPVINASYDSTAKKFTGSFGGTVVLTTSSQETLTFKLTFSETATDTWIQATYQASGQGLTFEQIASVFGFTLPPIPPDLDLDLTGATFRYDFSTGTLGFALTSKSYGTAAFVRMPLSGTTQNFFLLDTNQTFSLSNLPLVGEELAKLENIQVSQLTVLISSLTPILVNDASSVNGVITDLASALGTTLPMIPKAGTSGTFLITASLEFGTDTLPLSLSLGGSSQSGGSTALAAARAEGTAGAGGGGGSVTSSSGSDGVTWFTIQKSFGPVSLQRIGAMYQSSTQALWFEIDATLAFGPLTLSLSGLGIGSPLTSFAPKFSLSGLGVSYSNPPLTIAGGLVNLAPPGADYIDFEGGVTIGTGEFTLQAFGMYSDQPGFSTMFLFGDLAYDFGGPPAFFVTGVALGFGYNSSLRLPTIDEVATFPFVQVLPTSAVPNTGLFGGPNPTPLTVLNTILDTKPPWVSASAGSLWFAAGITFTSFELVNSQALVIVETGSELVIALIGTSRAQFPQGGDIDSAYAYIELDLEIRFAPSEGVFSVQANLAKSSFLLTKACVLTGGFAFFVWYGDNPNSGDFVLTLGGYNPGFTPPSYYPTVPQVGFHWSVDSSITISGGVYFALTPAVMMVGGELSATYQSGNLKAWFDAHADVIIRWKPFWFSADIGLTVGASYKLDLLFTSVTVSVELGCNLALWGPPTGGSVEVDWYIISFTIPFGASYQGAPPLKGWTDIQAMLPNTGTGSAPNVLSISPAAGLQPAATTPSGSSSSAKAPRAFARAAPLRTGDSAPPPAPTPWIVRGSQFSFSTSTPIPTTSATVGGTWSFNGSTFNVHPLGWTNVSATHQLTITDPKNADFSHAFQAVQVQRSVPASLWGSPPEDSSGNPQTPSGSDQVVPNQIVGLSLNVKPPQIGASAGPVDASTDLASIDLELTGANLPLSNSATPTGDVPVASDSTVATIADPAKGIGSSGAATARASILAALGTLGYAPQTPNDPMTVFAEGAGCAFVAQPLLVS